MLTLSANELGKVNSLDLDQAQPNTGTGLDLNCLTLFDGVRIFLEMFRYEEKNADNKKGCKIPQHAKS